MPTTDPITTDRLAAAIHTGMADQPLLATHARPVADRLAMLIRKRLPNITAADTGELMIHLAAFLSDVMTALTEEGESPTSAILIATSAIAMAGVELHGSKEVAAVPLADEIEARYILNPADADEWDRAYNTAVRDILRFVRGDLRPGLDIVRDAVRKARGGDAPPQFRGFA